MTVRAAAAMVLVFAGQGGAAQGAGIERASWLQGCWELTSAGRSVEESWTAAKGGTMIGVSRTLVFENPEHDFPQEVGYRRSGDALLAWIRGTQEGKDRRIEFPYVRARCGS
jgi:hypothetical protein